MRCFDGGQRLCLRLWDPAHMSHKRHDMDHHGGRGIRVSELLFIAFRWLDGDVDKAMSVIAPLGPTQNICVAVSVRLSCLDTQAPVRLHFIVKTYHGILYGRAEMNG